MRLRWCLVVGLILVLSETIGYSESFGIRLQAGKTLPAFGKYQTGADMTDYVDPGQAFSIAMNYGISRGISIEAGIDLGWMPISDDYKTDSQLDPAFVQYRIFFSNLIRVPVGPLVPYLRLGVNITAWRFTEDGIRGEVTEFEGEKMQKMSFGFHGGLGLEFKVVRFLSLYGEATLNYLLCRDRFFFGNDFTEQGILNLGGGLIFYLAQ